jgi:hypothetical protein
MEKPYLQLQLPFLLHKLRGRRRERHLAGLFNLGLENHLLALLPHFCYECLPWGYSAGEADFYVAERAVPNPMCASVSKGSRICKGECLKGRGDVLVINSLARKTKRAQAMQNWHLKSSHLGKCGVDV